MPLQNISQKSFFKGVNASAAYNSQPKGTVPRVSNMTLTTRGALRSCDQNLGICTLNGTGPAVAEGPFTSIQFFQPNPSLRKVLAFQRDTDTQVPTPAGLAAANGGLGGTLPIGTYYYVITATDGAGGETPKSNEVTITTAAIDLVNLSWTAEPAAAAYNIYRGPTSGSETLLASGIVGTTYVDNGSATVAPSSYTLLASPNGATMAIAGTRATYTFTTTGTNRVAPGGLFSISGASPAGYNSSYACQSRSGNSVIAVKFNQTLLAAGGGGTLLASASPPTVNTTQTLSLINASGLVFTKPGSIIYTFPSGQYPPNPPFPVGAVGGSYSGISGGGTLVNPAPGNIVGQSGPLPDQIPFAGLMMLILGNGLPPCQTDGSTGGTEVLGNTFTGAFPSWFATTAYAVGDIVQPVTPNGFVYTVTQGGISGGSEPTFPAGPGQTVGDNNIIWTQTGSNATPAPRGAAHAISHAGSLWLWNTAPTDSSDLLDGPSILKMSDANNPNSWNPVNVAAVGKNDGQQGMGMAAFTIAESGIPPEGSLVLFKEYSTYQVIGVFGATDFTIQEAQTDLGCISPRTIKFVPGFGIVRLTHLGFAVFDGVRDRLISEEIRPYLFGDQADISQMDFSWAYTAKADITAVPPMYCAAIPVLGQGNDGRLTRLCCYDLVLKAWTIIDLPFGISAVEQLKIPGSEPITVFGGWSDAMISRWQVGDQTGWQSWLDPSLVVHTGVPLVWSLRTPAAVGQSANDRITFRRVLAHASWLGSSTIGSAMMPNSLSTTSFSVAITVDGSSMPTAPVRPLLAPSGASTDSSVQLAAEIGRTGLDAYATISGVQAINGSPIVIDEVDWALIQRPTGSLVRV
jgi:hypothetical protein